MNFPYQLIKYRKQSQMTQTQLAKQLNINPSTISTWESGKREPKLKTLPKLAKLLNVSLVQLLSDESKEIKKSN